MTGGRKHTFIGIILAVGFFTSLLWYFVLPARAGEIGEDKVTYLVVNQGYKYLKPMSYELTKKAITVKFSDQLDYNTITADSVELIEKDSGEQVNIGLNQLTGREIQVFPRPAVPGKQALQSGKSYYLIIHGTVKNWDGKALKNGAIKEIAVNDAVASFQVQNINFVSADEVEVRFNQAIDDTSALKTSNYQVNGCPAAKVKAGADGKSVRFTLMAGLKTNTGKVVVSKDIKNIFNQALGVEYTRTITMINAGVTYNYNNQTINNNVNILAEGATLQKARVKGDMYIARDQAILENLTVDGTIFIDPGVTGSAILNYVTAADIEILSGAGGTISLNNVIVNNRMLVKSRSKVRVKAEGATAINTVVEFRNSDIALETPGSAFGTVEVSSQSSGANFLELQGTFSTVNVYAPAGIQLGASGTIGKLNLGLPGRDTVVAGGVTGSCVGTVTIMSPILLKVDNITINRLDIQTEETQAMALTLGSNAVVNQLDIPESSNYPPTTVINGGRLTINPVKDFACTGNTDKTANFSWTAPLNATGIKIQQSAAAGTENWIDAIMESSLTPTATSAVVSGLTANTAYKFKLVTTGGRNEGDSNVVQAAASPPAVMDFTDATLAAGSILGATSITWGSTLSGGATQVMYKIIAAEASYPTPAVDHVFDGTLVAAKNADITGADVAAGKQVVIVATGADKKIKACKVIALTNNNIKCTAAATLTGTAVASASETDIVNGGRTIIITLSNGQWASDLALDSGKRNALFDGLAADGAEKVQWDKVVNALKIAGATAITRNSNVQATITLPPAAEYDITTDQTITLTIPVNIITSSTAAVTATPTLKITAVTTAAITGTVVSAPAGEEDIAAGGKTIVITLANGQWADDIGTNPAKCNALYDGMTAGTETAQWAKVISALKTAGTGAITRDSDTVVTITLPGTSGYNINGNQTITLTIPNTIFTGTASPVKAAPSFVIASTVTATLTGTAVNPAGPMNESNIVAGEKTIIITLTGGQWASDIATEATKYNALYDGLAAGTETDQWAKVITALKTAGLGTITRDSDTQATIILPSVADYNINDNQTITLTVPVEAMAGAIKPVVAAPAIQVNTSATAAITGSILSGPTTEVDIVTGGKTIIITLIGGKWAADIASDATKRDALFGGFTAGSESTEWSKAVSALKADGIGAIMRSSDTSLIIGLPEVPGYNIKANQIITLTIPVSAIEGAGSPVIAPSFQIAAIPTAAITGTLVSAANEVDITAGGKTIIVTLTDGQWAADIVSDDTKRNNLFDGLVAENQGNVWAEVLTALKNAGAAALIRNSASQITITLPTVNGYNIATRQSITLTIPKSAIVGAAVQVTAAPVIQIAAVAELAGTVATPISEADITAGGKTIIVTLTDGQWASDINTDSTKYNALFDGLKAGTETAQWAKVVAALKAPGTIVRDTDYQITITLPATADYDITANQTITLTIPSAAVTGVTGPITAVPGFPIASTPKAAITGTITNATSKADIVAGGKTIIVTLTDGRWEIDVASDKIKREALLDGLAAGSEPNEWAKVMTSLKTSGEAAMIRNSSTKITITLPAAADYNITADQTITLTIPKNTMTGAIEPVIAASTFTITL